MNNRVKLPGTKGLTLIELIVVIAVVGVLAAIIMASISKVRNTAELASGLSAVKNIGAGISMYTNDNGGKLPHLRSTTQFVVRERRGPTTPNLVDRLSPYLEAVSVEPGEYVPGTVSKAFLDVADPFEKAAYYVSDRVKTTAGEYVPYPFGYVKRAGMEAEPQPLSLAMIEDPSKQYALIEYDAELRHWRGNVVGSQAFLVDEPWHGTKRVVLYFDGHTDVVSLDTNFHSDKRW